MILQLPAVQSSAVFAVSKCIQLVNTESVAYVESLCCAKIFPWIWLQFHLPNVKVQFYLSKRDVKVNLEWQQNKGN